MDAAESSRTDDKEMRRAGCGDERFDRPPIVQVRLFREMESIEIDAFPACRDHYAEPSTQALG